MDVSRPLSASRGESPPMRRFETRVEDGIYEIEGPEDWVRIGSFDDIVDTLGET